MPFHPLRRTLAATAFAFAGLVSLGLHTPLAQAADGPYNEQADAEAEVAQALAQAAKRPVLVVFGANWCPDCLLLDQAMKGGETAAVLKDRYTIVKVDVGRFNKNVALAERSGVTLKKGIPAVALLSPPKGEVLAATRAGELADARKMGDAGIAAWFKTLPATAR